MRHVRCAEGKGGAANDHAPARYGAGSRVLARRAAAPSTTLAANQATTGAQGKSEEMPGRLLNCEATTAIRKNVASANSENIPPTILPSLPVWPIASAPAVALTSTHPQAPPATSCAATNDPKPPQNRGISFSRSAGRENLRKVGAALSAK